MKTMLLLLLLSFVILAETPLVELFLNPVESKDSLLQLGEKMQELMGSHKVVRSHFVQKKEVKALNKELITLGEVLYSAQDGVIWHVKNPYQLLLVMSDSVVHLKDNSGWQALDGASFQTTRIHELLQSVYRGDISSLGTLFSIYFIETKAGWTLGLVPKRGRLKRFLSSLVIAGTTSQISQVRISAVEGGETSIDFSLADACYAPLTVEERALFNGK